VGEEDHVRGVVERLGRLQLWKLAIKPGKPLAYGHVLDVPFVGLPGNPVSAFVTFLLVVKPLLAKLQGQAPSAMVNQEYPVIADFEFPKPAGRQQYLRVRVQRHGSDLLAQTYGNQSSGALYSVSWADGLVVIPPGEVVNKGQQVRYLPL
jgi:molybdopterin molybdotransferase